MNNPFTLSFGKKPVQYISRITQTNEIIDNFNAELPSNQIYMITGVRGSGKTVMMTNISTELGQLSNWITVELNPTRDLLQSLAAKIYSIPDLHECFIKAKLDFSAFGLGVSIEHAPPVTDIEDVLMHMLSHIQKLGKRLLITIDEVTNSENIKIFTSSFQIFLKALTFLYRAPKLILEPLNYTAVRKSYADIFQIDLETAEKMTSLTKGYPFAYQVLGYLYWLHRDTKSLEEILPEYDQYLEEYVYSKIWSELSELDKKILIEIATSGEYRIKNIRERLGMRSELFSVYRERLKRKGVIDTREYGKIFMALPRFAEFVKVQLL